MLTESQQDAIDRLYNFDHTLLIAPKGFGKAVVGQTAVQDLLREGAVRRVLVVAPKRVVDETWSVEWRKWSHLEQPCVLTGSVSVRRKLLARGEPLCVINYELLPWLLRETGCDFDAILYDEVSKLKSPNAKAVRALRPRLKHFRWRAGLSATPLAEQGEDIYSQALVIDGGEALGRSIDRFRLRYRYPTDYMQYEWEWLPDGQERLAGDLAGLVHVVDGLEYERSLPPLVNAEHLVELPDDARERYELLAREMLLGEDIEAANMAVLTGKLQQLAAGAVYTSGVEREARWFHTAKFDALDYWLEADPKNTLISYQYQFELAELKRRYGERLRVLVEDPTAVRDWCRGEVELLAVHPRSAGHGLNLQSGGARLICLGPFWSADQWDQLVGRLRRRGQQQEVERIVLVARDTVDQAILIRLRDKADGEQQLMEHIKRLTQ